MFYELQNLTPCCFRNNEKTIEYCHMLALLGCHCHHEMAFDICQMFHTVGNRARRYYRVRMYACVRVRVRACVLLDVCDCASYSTDVLEIHCIAGEHGDTRTRGRDRIELREGPTEKMTKRGRASERSRDRYRDRETE